RGPIISLALALTFRSPFSAVELCAQRPPIERTVDATIRPGDDFFAFANGAWLAAAVIPPGRDRWSVRDEIAERTREQIAALLNGARGAPSGSLARKVADFRAALLDRASIEARGLSGIRQALSDIDRATDKVAIARLLGASMRADVDPLNIGIYRSSSVLGLSVEHSIHGETGYTAFLVQGGLAL